MRCIFISALTPAQVPSETEVKPPGNAGSQAVSQAALTPAVKASNPYDPSQASYPQYASHHAALPKEYTAPAAKYSTSHVPTAGQTASQNLAQAVNQTPLTVGRPPSPLRPPVSD